MKNLGIVVLCTTLVGCASTPQEAKMSLAETKQMILASKDRFWKDSAAIKNARIGTTSACIAFGDCVCVESNAKNSSSGSHQNRLSRWIARGRGAKSTERQIALVRARFDGRV
jgi:hypothetical protein